jgi:hypothetical protein
MIIMKNNGLNTTGSTPHWIYRIEQQEKEILEIARIEKTYHK